MDKTLIAWNVPNIVTIWLMAAVGFLIAGIGAQIIMNGMSGGSLMGDNPPPGS